MSWAGLPLPPLGIGGTRRNSMTTAITANPPADTKKEVSRLVWAMMNPPIAGNTMRVLDQTAEFSATALIMSLRSIR